MLSQREDYGVIGFGYRKPKAIPQAASAEKQANFIAMYQCFMTELSADEAAYLADGVR